MVGATCRASRVTNFITYILVVADSAQTLGIHWLLLPYDPRTSRDLLRFDVIFPVDQICYQHSNTRERLPEADLDAPASTAPLTNMTITFEQWPFFWTIDVDQPKGIRCRHVFEAIYNSFNQQLTLGELWRVPDRRTCEEAFRRRITVRGGTQAARERSRGWKRVDVLLHHTLFHGLTMTPDGRWVLHLGAPMPVPTRHPSSRALACFQLAVPDQSLSMEDARGDDAEEHKFAPIPFTSIKEGLSSPSVRDLAPVPAAIGGRRDSDSTDAGSTESADTQTSLPIAISPVLPRQQIGRSRPTHRPLGPRHRPRP